ncbi:MAG: murein biosynthesis integral membrane protein MurJ [Candidatus Parcubacteria bacterium]|nr:murein biosynthesis integral membrane protein MurJ [Candidatus Parcubacteria bacterium]
MIKINRHILNSGQDGITGAAILIAVAALISSLLGVVRDALLASNLGLSRSLDIYYASFRVPDFFYNIFIYGAITVGFIPVLTAYLKKDKEEAWQLTSGLCFWLGVFLFVCGILVVIFAPYLCRIFFPGFNVQELGQTVSMMRILMLQPILLGLSSIYSAVLEVFRLFLADSLAPILYNIGIILGIIFFLPKFGLLGLVLGVVLGAFLSLLVRILAMRELGYHWGFDYRAVKAGLRKIVKLMVPRSMSIILYQIYMFIVVALASKLPAGHLAAFNLANNIQSLPQVVIALSLIVSSFPILARLYNEQNEEGFSDVFENTLKQSLFLMVPITGLFFVLRYPIVRLLLGYGKFSWGATNLTANILFIFLVGLIFQALHNLLIRTFFARDKSSRPFFASLITYTAGIFLASYLARTNGILGLAWAFVFTNIIYFIILLILLLPFLKKVAWKSLLYKLGEYIFITLGAGLMSMAFLRFTGSWFNETKVLGVLGQSFSVSLIFCLVLYAEARIMKIEEIVAVKKIALRFLKSR